MHEIQEDYLSAAALRNRSEEGRRAAQTARARLGEDIHVRRGEEAIATARANGKMPPVFERPCEVCATPFRVPPSRARIRRCPTCIEKGRAKCVACPKEVSVSPGARAYVRCADCKAKRSTATRRVPLVELQCRGARTPWGIDHAETCQRTYPRSRSAVKQIASYEAEAGTFVSGPCSSWQSLIAMQVDEMRRRGWKTPASKATYRKFLAERLQSRPETGAAQRARPEALIAARKAGEGGLAGPAKSRLQMATTWRHGSKWLISQCLHCGRLMMISTAPTAARPRLHQRCYHEVLQTEEGREWRRNRLSRRRFAADHPPVEKRRGRRRDPDTLTRDFGWAVRHLLGGETHAQLAAEGHLDRSVVTKAIRGVVELLPEPEVADARLRRYVDALREASAA